MQFIHIYLVFKGRIRIIAAVLLVTLLTTIIVTAVLPNKYLATTSLVIDFHTINPFQQLGIPSSLSSTYMTTQTDIIRSLSVAQKVVDMLKLTQNPTVREKFQAKTGGKGAIRDWLAGILKEEVEIELSRDSQIITINYTSPDPKFSAAVANAFAQAYIDKNLELSIEPARQNTKWFDEQLKSLRSSLEVAQTRLTEYQQEKGIVAIDERLDTETYRLKELSTQLVAAQAQTYDVNSRQLGTNHPEYKRAVKREAAIQESLKEQKIKVLGIKKQRDELMILSRDAENRQKTYDAAIQRYYQSSLESQFNQTNIAILTPANEPTESSGPFWIRNIFLSLFLGVFLGAGIAYTYELFDRRIRTETDLTECLGVPVLCSL